MFTMMIPIFWRILHGTSFFGYCIDSATSGLISSWDVLPRLTGIVYARLL